MRPLHSSVLQTPRSCLTLVITQQQCARVVLNVSLFLILCVHLRFDTVTPHSCVLQTACQYICCNLRFQHRGCKLVITHSWRRSARGKHRRCTFQFRSDNSLSYCYPAMLKVWYVPEFVPEGAKTPVVDSTVATGGFVNCKAWCQISCHHRKRLSRNVKRTQRNTQQWASGRQR